jgi:hypothetical protein
MAQDPNQPANASGAYFVRQIVVNPNNVPDVMRLYGYPGASSEPGHERLYLNPDLTNYVEVPAQATLHRMAVPSDQDPYGAIVLWVKKDATLIYKMAPAAQAMANYFTGAIQAGMTGLVPGTPGGRMAPQAPAAAAMAPQAFAMRPTIADPQCPYPTEVCTHAGPCATRFCWFQTPAWGPAAAAMAPQVAPAQPSAGYPCSYLCTYGAVCHTPGCPW